MASSMTIEADAPTLVLARARDGDEAAFALIVAEHHESMARIAYLVSGDLATAEEAEQAAWSKVWQRLGDVRDADRLRAWLMSVAANEARQLVRSQGRRQVRELAVSPTEGTTSGPDHAALIDLANTLARLDPRDRAILGLRYIAGLDSTEIGRAVGLSPSGVRVRLGRLLARLREELHDA
jgi:RNA polymerase sigma-70 factor (ECF subfamily)